MSMQNTKCHNYVHIAVLLILVILGIFLSPPANAALNTTVRNVSGLTLGANSVNVGVRIYNVRYLKHIQYLPRIVRDGIATTHIEHWKAMCEAIAQRLWILNVPVVEITITPIKDIPGLGWKTKTCKVTPAVNIVVD